MREGSLDVARLREEFDASFTTAAAPRPETQDFLTLRIGDDPYAVRVAELAGIHRDRTVRSMNSRGEGGFLGLAHVRGAMSAVYDLGVLLGYPANRAPLPWIVVVRGPALVALAFESFGAHVRLPLDAVSEAAGGNIARKHVRGAVDAEGVTHPLIDLESLLEAISTRATHQRKRDDR